MLNSAGGRVRSDYMLAMAVPCTIRALCARGQSEVKWRRFEEGNCPR